MYLIDCRECRTRISDEATLCPICGSLLFYRHSKVKDAPRHAEPEVLAGEAKWLGQA